MIVNPDKFKGTIVERNNKMKDSRPLNIYQEVINPERCVKLLGFEIDHKISFERLISNQAKKQVTVKCNQQNTNVYGFQRKINFDKQLCLWQFCSAKPVKRKKIQERPRILHNDFSSDHESILNKSGKSTLEVKRLRTPALEVFKTLNTMNTEYMKYRIYAFSTHRPLNLEVNRNHKTKYGNKSLRVGSSYSELSSK